MAVLCIVAAVIAFVLGLADVTWLGASQHDWTLVGLIAFALAHVAGAIPWRAG